MQELKRLLEGAVRGACDQKNTGLIFSGGVDSTLIGMLAGKFSNVTGYAVGIKGSPDIEYARETENCFPVKIIEIDEKDIEGTLPLLLKAIKEPNPLKAAVGVPFYFASKRASKDGVEAMLCGQGADELFGGYKRYVDAIPEGMEKVRKMMKRDVEEIFEKQLQYDSRVCELNGCELRFPYMDEKFVRHVLDIPVGDKIKRVENGPEYGCVDVVNGDRYIRKHLLRKVAEEFGVPEEILNRPKKAAQYGSGVQKVIDRIARKQGYKAKAAKAGRRDYLRFYIEDIYRSATKS